PIGWSEGSVGGSRVEQHAVAESGGEANREVPDQHRCQTAKPYRSRTGADPIDHGCGWVGGSGRIPTSGNEDRSGDAPEQRTRVRPNVDGPDNDEAPDAVGDYAQRQRRRSPDLHVRVDDA